GQAGSRGDADTQDRTTPFRDMCGKCGARRVDNQIGLEPTPDLFVQTMVDVFREVRRVLADHGTCWINLGDNYAQGHGGSSTEGNYTMRKESRATLPPSTGRRCDGGIPKSEAIRNVIPA